MEKSNKPSKEEIQEENRKIRRLRLLIDFTISLLYQSSFTLPEALKLIENTKAIALSLFPGKEHVYDLIYKPRFERILTEIYGSQTIH
jgi:hypothetical protein